MKSDIGWIILFIVACGLTFVCGVAARGNYDLRRGYIECLVDIQNNKPMRYVLKKQEDGETRWAKNTEAEE